MLGRIGRMQLLGVALALVLSASAALEAKTVELPGQAASIDLPDSWTAQPQTVVGAPSVSSLILAAINPEKTSMLQIQFCGNPHGLLAGQPNLVTSTKDQISNQIAARGGQVQFTSEGRIDLNTVPAYLVQYTETTKSSKQIFTRLYQVAANGKLYLITLRTVDSASDPGLQTIAGSFRFDAPPTLPSPPVSHHWLKIALVAGAGVAVLAAIVIGILIQKRREQYV